MMKLAFAALALLPSLALAGGPNLRRAEERIQSECRTVTTGTALEFFNVSYSTNSRTDQKEILIQSMDISYSTNSIRVSSHAATTDAQGYPVVGFASPFRLAVSAAAKIFVRRRRPRGSPA